MFCVSVSVSVCLWTTLNQYYHVFLQELPLPDIPIMMTLLEERPSGKLCVAYRQGHIDAVNEISGETTRLVTLEGKVVFSPIVY